MASKINIKLKKRASNSLMCLQLTQGRRVKWEPEHAVLFPSLDEGEATCLSTLFSRLPQPRLRFWSLRTNSSCLSVCSCNVKYRQSLCFQNDKQEHAVELRMTFDEEIKEHTSDSRLTTGFVYRHSVHPSISFWKGSWSQSNWSQHYYQPIWNQWSTSSLKCVPSSFGALHQKSWWSYVEF